MQTKSEQREQTRRSVTTEVRFTTPYTDTYVTWVPGGSTFNVFSPDGRNVDVFTHYSDEKGSGYAPTLREARRYAADWFADIFFTDEDDR